MTLMPSTSAALCTVQVSNDVLQKDLVLHLVLKLVQQKTHQVTVETVTTSSSNNKGSPNNVLKLSLAGTVPPLQQRNAILRSLVGAALHGALDHGLLLGGGLLAAAASPHATSSAAAANAARQQQWMSVADALRHDGNGADATADSLMNELDQILTTSAFVLPYAAQPSLADLDLGVALLSSSSSKLTTATPFPRSVQRWLKQIGATLQHLANETGVSLESYQLDKAFLNVEPTPIAAPMFFDGTEDAAQLLNDLYKTKDASPPKQQSQQQMKKEGEKPVDKSNVDKQVKQKKASDVPKQQPPQQVPMEYDVTALDIRVGKIIKVWPHEDAEKLFCEDIDLGNGEIRQIASGLRPFYQAQDLQDRFVLVLCNLKKRNLVGFASHGMVLCASNADHTAVELVQPAAGTAIGERVVFDGLSSQPPEPESKVAKKKIFEQLAPQLQTDATGAVMWKSHAAQTSAGPVTALHNMPNASVS